MTYHIIGHVVRRGVQTFQSHVARQQYDNEQQEQEAQLYEQNGEEVKPQEIIPVLITGLVGLLIILSIDYTLGQVMSALTMIESPSRAAIVDSAAPPPYVDTLVEQEPLVAGNKLDDLEITIVEYKPITTSIRATLAHLNRVGGFFAKWRGIGLMALYNIIHCLCTNLIVHLIGLGLIGEVLTYIFVSLGLARLHMAWTHSMIAHQSSKRWFHRLPARKDCKALLLPTLVYATAQQATFLLPLGVAFALGLIGPNAADVGDAPTEKEALDQLLRGLAIPLTYALVGLAILFPASVTLTRIEAVLLPEDMQTVVHFDKAAVMGDVDLSVRGGCRRLFVQAWRSFDRASRWRLVKLYVKIALAQIAITIVTLHLMAAELYVLGAERMPVFLRSVSAQANVMALKAARQVL